MAMRSIRRRRRRRRRGCGSASGGVGGAAMVAAGVAAVATAGCVTAPTDSARRAAQSGPGRRRGWCLDISCRRGHRGRTDWLNRIGSGSAEHEHRIGQQFRTRAPARVGMHRLGERTLRRRRDPGQDDRLLWGSIRSGHEWQQRLGRRRRSPVVAGGQPGFQAAPSRRPGERPAESGPVPKLPSMGRPSPENSTFAGIT